MKKFLLGIIVGTAFWLTILGSITIPEYTIEYQCTTKVWS
jgi:hypothetical protein